MYCKYTQLLTWSTGNRFFSLLRGTGKKPSSCLRLSSICSRPSVITFMSIGVWLQRFNLSSRSLHSKQLCPTSGENLHITCRTLRDVGVAVKSCLGKRSFLGRLTGKADADFRVLQVQADLLRQAVSKFQVTPISFLILGYKTWSLYR